MSFEPRDYLRHILGEATKKIPEDSRVQYPGVEWRAMAAMRDRLTHNYFGVDYELVWMSCSGVCPD